MSSYGYNPPGEIITNPHAARKAAKATKTKIILSPEVCPHCQQVIHGQWRLWVSETVEDAEPFWKAFEEATP